VSAVFFKTKREEMCERDISLKKDALGDHQFAFCFSTNKPIIMHVINQIACFQSAATRRNALDGGSSQCTILSTNFTN